MTLIEIYNMCKLLFPDKEVECSGNAVHILWYVKSTYVQHGTDRHIWIFDYDTHFRIDSNLFKLPSWFKKVVKYKSNMSEEKIFIGFNV